MRKKIIAILVLVSLINIAGIVTAEDEQEATHSGSTLTVTVTTAAPNIEWYNFTNATGVSKINQDIDVYNEYNFTVRINDTNGWSDIQYVNITAWYDNGSDSTTYNQSEGANLNMFLQYKNTTATAEWSMLWPTDGEATFGTYEEVVIDDNTHNLTFRFTPGNQTRHTPGTLSGTTQWDDIRTWNYNISVVDADNNKDSEKDEYGIYMCTKILSAGDPSMSGAPGTTADASSINVETVSNGNYSLYVNVSELDGPGAETISNTTISLDSTAAGKTGEYFDGTNPIYLYGTVAPTYAYHSTSGTKLTTDITFHCDIPLGKPTGDYTSKVYYCLTTQNA